jgi:hypothetical protein
VVGVPAAVVADGGADVFGDGVELGDQDLHVARVCLGVLLQSGVEVGEVGAVVLLVVEGLMVLSSMYGSKASQG